MLERNMTVGQVATALPKSMDYFRALGVDYCCGGNRLLTQVLRERGLSENQVFARLEELEAQLTP